MERLSTPQRLSPVLDDVVVVVRRPVVNLNLDGVAAIVDLRDQCGRIRPSSNGDHRGRIHSRIHSSTASNTCRHALPG